jgi:predicted dithiol-disulfide oxidoreductase (DUF899 family)
MLLEDRNTVLYGAVGAISGAVTNWTFLDLTPLGRQEEWERLPGGLPQTPPCEWWRRHDEDAQGV